MGLIKGSVSLTRYHVLETPGNLSDEYIADQLKKNAFMDIDTNAVEDSMGWVEVLDNLSTEFAPHSFNFGPVLIFGLRVDTRRIPAKVLKRYVAMAEAEAAKVSGRSLSGDQRRELKSRVYQDLLLRTPVNTDVFEVCWFPQKEELWLAGVGNKVRERLEDIWRRTFQLGILMKVPFVLAHELMPADISRNDLEQVLPSALYGGRRIEDGPY